MTDGGALAIGRARVGAGGTCDGRGETASIGLLWGTRIGIVY